MRYVGDSEDQGYLPCGGNRYTKAPWTGSSLALFERLETEERYSDYDSTCKNSNWWQLGVAIREIAGYSPRDSSKAEKEKKKKERKRERMGRKGRLNKLATVSCTQSDPFVANSTIMSLGARRHENPIPVPPRTEASGGLLSGFLMFAPKELSVSSLHYLSCLSRTAESWLR